MVVIQALLKVQPKFSRPSRGADSRQRIAGNKRNNVVERKGGGIMTNQLENEFSRN